MSEIIVELDLCYSCSIVSIVVLLYSRVVVQLCYSCVTVKLCYCIVL